MQEKNRYQGRYLSGLFHAGEEKQPLQRSGRTGPDTCCCVWLRAEITVDDVDRPFLHNVHTLLRHRSSLRCSYQVCRQVHPLGHFPKTRDMSAMQNPAGENSRGVRIKGICWNVRQVCFGPSNCSSVTRGQSISDLVSDTGSAGKSNVESANHLIMTLTLTVVSAFFSCVPWSLKKELPSNQTFTFTVMLFPAFNPLSSLFL